MDYPKIQRWDTLCNLVDKVRDMDAAFSYSGRRDCVLRELGCLSAHGGVFFQLLCEHVRASLAIAGDVIYSQHDVAGHVFDAFYHAYLKWLQRGGAKKLHFDP